MDLYDLTANDSFVTTTTWELASCNKKLVCLRLYWYCTEKFYVSHSWDSKDWAVYYYGLALIIANFAPKKLGPKCFIHSDDSFQVITCAFLTAARKAVAVSLTSFVSSVTSLDLLGIGDSISILTPSARRAKASVVRFFTHFVLISLLLSFSVGKFAAKTTRTPWKLMPQ